MICAVFFFKRSHEKPEETKTQQQENSVNCIKSVEVEPVLNKCSLHSHIPMLCNTVRCFYGKLTLIEWAHFNDKVPKHEETFLFNKNNLETVALA